VIDGAALATDGIAQVGQASPKTLIFGQNDSHKLPSSIDLAIYSFRLSILYKLKLLSSIITPSWLVVINIVPLLAPQRRHLYTLFWHDTKGVPMKRPLLTAFLVACFALVLTSCVTVHPDKKAKGPSEFVEVTASPSYGELPDKTSPTNNTADDASSPSQPKEPSRLREDTSRSQPPSPAASRNQPSTAPTASGSSSQNSPAPAPDAIPEDVPDPCKTLADSDLSKISRKQYGDVVTAESPTTIMGRKAWSCRTGSNPSLQLTVLVDDADLTAWRTALQSARVAGDFAYVSGVGTKAFRGGEFVIGVRVGTLVLLYADPKKALSRVDAIDLVKKTLAKLS